MNGAHPVLHKWTNTCNKSCVYKLPSFPPLKNTRCAQIGPRKGFDNEHIFDGYGHMSVIDFQEDRISIKTKNIVPLENKIETLFNKKIFKGVFTEKQNDNAPLYIKSCSNTNIYPLDDNKFMTLGDGGFSHIIDMDKDTWCDKKLWFTPHYSPHYIQENESSSYFFSLLYVGRKANIYIYNVKKEIPETPTMIHEVNLPFFTYIHDFQKTNKYFIFYLNPVEYANDNTKNIVSNINISDTRSGFWLFIDTETGEETYVPCSKTFLYPIIMHHINAYEKDETGDCIIINSVCLNNLDLNNNIDGGIFQFNINLKTLTCTQKYLSSKFGEFPVYHKQYVYYLTDPNEIWFTTLTRVNLMNIDRNTWVPPEFVLLNECTCISDYVVVVGYHYIRNSSILFILDEDLNLLYKYDIGTNIGFALHTQSITK
jgi:carotenoid cleavage dioxygenase-like enzyme